jgi:hypothetical protein
MMQPIDGLLMLIPEAIRLYSHCLTSGPNRCVCSKPQIKLHIRIGIYKFRSRATAANIQQCHSSRAFFVKQQAFQTHAGTKGQCAPIPCGNIRSHDGLQNKHNRKDFKSALVAEF